MRSKFPDTILAAPAIRFGRSTATSKAASRWFRRIIWRFWSGLNGLHCLMVPEQAEGELANDAADKDRSCLNAKNVGDVSINRRNLTIDY